MDSQTCPINPTATRTPIVRRVASAGFATMCNGGARIRPLLTHTGAGPAVVGPVVGSGSVSTTTMIPAGASPVAMFRDVM